MPGLPTASIENPWAAALLALGILLPRLALRLGASNGALIEPRRNIATIAAIFSSLSLLPVAALMGVWSWVYAVPAAGAAQLMKAEPNYEYFLGLPVAWLVASYFVLPLASFVVSRSQYPGLLLVTSSSVGLSLVGAASALAWSQPISVLPLTTASGFSLGIASSLAFALAARIPLKAHYSAAGAA